MDIKEINSAIDYCIGRVKLHESAIDKLRKTSNLTSLEKRMYTKHTKRLKHYAVIKEALEFAKQTILASECGEHTTKPGLYVWEDYTTHWITREGESLLPSEMSLLHLQNTVHYIERELKYHRIKPTAIPIYNVLFAELMNRTKLREGSGKNEQETQET